MKIQKFSHLFSDKLFNDIFSNSQLYEKDSFYYIDPLTLSYDQSKLTTKTFVEKAALIKEMYNLGSTIIVKNLESFNPTIVNKCNELGDVINLHMYLCKDDGSVSFDFHSDDSDVLIHLLYGSKKFELKEEGVIKSITLSAGDEIFIKKGTSHRAISLSASCLLSFGFSESSFYVPGGLNFLDCFPVLEKPI
jgi:mannose-6-phosphate isomerase-like protein (cupin superfamily)